MNLTSWKGSIVRKQDINMAKNYLIHDEIDTLNRLVVIFLESAELRPKSQIARHYIDKYNMNLTGMTLNIEVPEIIYLINLYDND